MCLITGEDDLDTVYCACKKICAVQWYEFGLQLGFRSAVLDIIKEENSLTKSLLEVLKRWLERSDIQQGYSLPSWKTLCMAMKGIGKLWPAVKIGRDHLAAKTSMQMKEFLNFFITTAYMQVKALE